MLVAGREQLEAFCRKHPDARAWVERWLADLELAVWRRPGDIRNSYASASFLAENIVIFNVKGNDYRLETTVVYSPGIVIVRWVGTHRDYDRRNRKR